MQGKRAEKPVGELISDLYHREVKLIRQEIEFAKVEMSINARRAVKYFMLFVAGGAIFLAALVVLLHGLVVALFPVFPPVSSALVVSFCAGGVGLLIMGIGIYKLSKEEFAPRRAMEAIEQSVETVREETA